MEVLTACTPRPVGFPQCIQNALLSAISLPHDGQYMALSQTELARSVYGQTVKL